MKEITLKPIYDYHKYSDMVARVLDFEVYYLLFKPLFDVLGTKPGEEIKHNEVEVKEGRRWNKVGSELARALLSGKVTYVDGWFTGNFSATISRELRRHGARYNHTRKAYKIDLSGMDAELKVLISQSREKAKIQAADLIRRIDEAKAKTLEVDISKYVSGIVADLNKQAVQTIKVTPEKLEVPMELSAYVAQEIKQNYSSNLNLYINGWKDEQTERLREQVQQAVEAGFRADKMAKVLESEYGSSKRRAKFIARQETSLLVSKYRQARYEEAGLREYVWQTSHDERVRADHRDLNGKRFSFDHPPVVDKARGRRANPGEDFGCRCIAVPVMRIGA